MQVTAEPGLITAYVQALFTLSYEKDLLVPYTSRIFDTFLDAMLADLTGCKPAGG